MNAKEALEAMCEHCHKTIQSLPSKGNLPHKECPFRHISNDYCEEYETVMKRIASIDAMERKNGIAIEILFKASENGIYRKMANGVTFFPPDEISVYLDHIETESGKILYGFEYGETWALTKEELK